MSMCCSGLKTDLDVFDGGILEVFLRLGVAFHDDLIAVDHDLDLPELDGAGILVERGADDLAFLPYSFL